MHLPSTKHDKYLWYKSILMPLRSIYVFSKNVLQQTIRQIIAIFSFFFAHLLKIIPQKQVYVCFKWFIKHKRKYISVACCLFSKAYVRNVLKFFGEILTDISRLSFFYQLIYYAQYFFIINCRSLNNSI